MGTQFVATFNILIDRKEGVHLCAACDSLVLELEGLVDLALTNERSHINLN